jgi:hypothetical protein
VLRNSPCFVLVMTETAVFANLVEFALDVGGRREGG